mmetsp:Transcript_17210/g.16877  ORF Transcript_17210/g.16877 Transcript_17210/m.16877 type:complete len:103 (+) Transcript_17210:772-1080(+)
MGELMINDLRMKFQENQRIDDSLHVDFLVTPKNGLKSAILIESDQNMNIELKEKGFYNFKKRLLRKKGIPIVSVNELGWEDYTYQQKISEIGRISIDHSSFR